MGGDTVPATKAHMNATNRYMAKAYDSLRIIVPKGRKAEIEAYVREHGTNTNALVNMLLRKELGMDEARWKKRESTPDR